MTTREETQQGRSSNYLSMVVLPLLILVCVGFTRFATDLPSVKPAGSDPELFSAERALVHIAEVAKEPHPLGTKAHTDAQNYLVETLSGLGLEPVVSETAWQDELRWFGGVYYKANLKNIMASIPARTGAPGRGAIMLMAHYDSVVNAPGAADDGSGVGTIIEVTRALLSGGPIDRDVILLFTDGEEAGLLGAKAFFAHNPLAEAVDLVINMEAAGSDGPAFMFETSPNNAALIDAFDSAADRPAANSLMASLYRVMPNDTDMSEALDRGIAGMNFAFIGTKYDYHTAGDNVENLSLKSVQHTGDQVLALVREIADRDDLTAETDAVYTDILSHIFIKVSPSTMTISVLVMIGLMVGLLAAGGERNHPDYRAGAVSVLQGAGAALLMIVTTGLVLQMVFILLGGSLGFGGDVVATRFLLANEGKLLACLFLLTGLLSAVMLHGLTKGASLVQVFVAATALMVLMILAGFADVAVAGGILLLGLLWLGVTLRPLPLMTLWHGGLFLVAVLALLMQFALPGGVYLLSIPLTFALFGALRRTRLKDEQLYSGRRAVALALWLVPAVMTFTYIIPLLYGSIAMAMGAVGVMAVPFGLATVFVLPLIAPYSGRAGFALLGVATVVAAAVLLTSDFSERFKRPDDLWLLKDEDAGTLHFATRLRDPGPWASQRIGDERQPLNADFGLLTRFQTENAGYGPALQDAPSDDLGVKAEWTTETSLTVTPRNAGELLVVQFTAQRPIGTVTIDGSRTDMFADRRSFAMLYQVSPVGGVEITFDALPEGFRGRVFSVRYDPEEAYAALYPDMPEGVMAAPYGIANALVSTRVVSAP